MNIIKVDATNSTSTLIASLFRSGAIEIPSALYAIDQTGGRGRLERPWSSEPFKNLTISYVLPDFGIFFEAFTCGVLVLGIHFSTYTAEVFRAGIDNVHKGQWEAAKSLNYNQYQTWKNVILPQAIPPMITPLANYLITMFKETPLLAAITVVELFRAADQYSNSHYKYLEPMTLVGVFFLIVSIPSAIIAMKLEKRFKQRKI